MGYEIKVPTAQGIVLHTKGTRVKDDIEITINENLLPQGTIEITTNGEHSVAYKSIANVHVPIPEGYIKPEGNINITNTAEVDVANYATAKVVDNNLIAENIAKDIAILGVVGTFEGGTNTDYEDGILTGTLAEYTNDRITSLKDYAFYKAKLKYFNSTSLKTLGGSCFSNSQLIECNIPNAQYATSGASFDGCTKLTKLYLPNISSTFSNNCKSCTSLTYVYFEEVSTISNSCFNGCTSLTTLIINKTSLCTLGSTNVFTNTPIARGTGYIYVPDDLVESYKVATNWSAYADQIKPLSEYVEE